MSTVLAFLRCTTRPSTVAAPKSKRRTQQRRLRTSAASTSNLNRLIPTTMSTPNSAPSSSRSSRQPSSNIETNARSERGDRGGLRGGGRGRAIANAVFEQSTAGTDSASSQRQQDSGGWRGRGAPRAQGDGHLQSRGRGGGRGGGRAGGRNEPPAPRPTHSLPLHTHPRLASLVSSFQSALLAHDPAIAGLNGSIVIDPRRLHLTLGVMALEEEHGPASTSTSQISRPPGARGTPATTSLPVPSSTLTHPTDPGQHPPTDPKRTVESALALLRSLRPQISTILAGACVKVPLEKMDAFPPGATSNANVLFLGPDESKPTRRRNGNGRNNGERSEWDVLWSVAHFVHQAFKSAGYITDTRPLKLHCTILNASHRKPRFPRYGFSFADVLKAEEITTLLGATNSSSYLALPEPEPGVEREEERNDRANVAQVAAGSVEPAMRALSIGRSETTVSGGSNAASTSESTARTANANPKAASRRNENKWPKSRAVPVKVGTYDVSSVELWVMGSHGPNNEYVSLGGIVLE